MVHEKKIILNDPLPQDIAIALEHDFDIIEPNDIPNVKKSKENVLTIGAGFYYALEQSPHSEYAFPEGDFKIDTAMGKDDIMSQLVAATGMLERSRDCSSTVAQTKVVAPQRMWPCFPPSPTAGGPDRKPYGTLLCPNYEALNRTWTTVSM